MVDDRDTQVSFNGSFTLSFASQVLFDKAEYFDHINTLLAQQTIYSSGRSVRTDIFYESFFISVFAYLESMTGQVCDDLATILHKSIRLNDLNERSKFEGTRKYLNLLADSEFPTKQTFGELTTYRKVRNNIAHGNSLLAVKEKDEKAIEKLPGVRRNEEGCLEVTPKFCTEFLIFCHKYVKELKCIADEIATRAKRKATLVT